MVLTGLGSLAGGTQAVTTLTGTKSMQAMYQVHRNLRKDGDKNNTGEKYIANLTPRDGCKALTLKMSVAADGKSYTLENPRNGHKRTFKTRRH